MFTRSQSRKKVPSAAASASSRTSSTTVRAQMLAAEAQHLKRIQELERAVREKDLAAERVVAEAEYRAQLATLEAEDIHSRQSSTRSSHGPDTTAHNVPSHAEAEGAAAVTFPDRVPGTSVVDAAKGRSELTVAAASLPASAINAGHSRDFPNPSHRAAPLHYTLGTQNCQCNKDDKANTLQLAKAIAAVAAATASKINKVSFPLPIFDGRPSDWLVFKKVYNDTSKSFTCSENLTRLNASLRGAARDSVAVLLAAVRDPTDVLYALETAFARPEQIILSQVSALRALPKLAANENSNELNTFACKVRNCVEVVRLLKRPEYLASPELSNEIVSKLTPILRSRWIDFAHSQEHTNMFRIELLSEYLMREANLRSKYDVMPLDITVKNIKCHATAAPVSAIDRPNDTKQVCLFCGNAQHNVKSCNAFTDLSVDQRWEWVIDKKVCHRCLIKGGHSYRFCKRFSCNVRDCERKTRHHSLLHKKAREVTAYTGLTSEPQLPSVVSKNEPVLVSVDDNSIPLTTLTTDKPVVITNSTSTSSSLRTLLKVVAVTISGPKGSYETYALLDDGSTATLLDSKVASAIGAEGRKGQITVNGVGGMSRQTEVSFVDIKVRGRHSSETHFLQNVRAIPNLDLASQSIKVSDLNSASYLTELTEILTYDEARPMLLVGIDNWQLSVPRCVRKGSWNQPVAALTAFGWMLFGSIRNACSPVEFVHHNMITENTNSLDVQLNQYFRIDSIVINAKDYLGEADKRAIDILAKTTHRLRSNSITILKRLRSDAHSFKQFVAHRVGEIAKISNIADWRYMPTGMNVAHDATRIGHKFEMNSRWFSGPEFLTSPTFDWPVEPVVNPTPTPEEMKRSSLVSEAVGLTNVQNSFLPVVVNFTRFSNYLRLLRATARIFCCAREFDSLLSRPQKAKFHNRDSRKSEQSLLSLKPLLVEDMTLAERHLFLRSQIDAFENERSCLRSGKLFPKRSRLSNLARFIDVFGLLRLSGRISALEITGISKNPIVLDGNHSIIRLLIGHHHQKAAHSYNELVVNELRQEFFILGLRPAVKKVTNSCLMCRIRKSVPPVPPIGDLPLKRLDHHTRPFNCVGLDYFGPVSVTVGRRTEKRYVALFTCLTVRAIHLEVVGSLTSDSAIMALRRFIARRGCPSTLLSDNGTAFVGANKELSALYTKPVQECVLNQRINWKFIPPAAPFMGGCWERLDRSVKTSLKATMKERAPREEVLHTFLLEVEGILNSRPLTHVLVDPGVEEAITPFHFILGSASLHSPLAEFTDADLIRRVHWKKAQRFADHFWTRWVREYLPSLVPRPDARGKKNLEPGDLVLVADGNLPRGSWPRGRITRTFPGSDGVVRVAEVAVRGGLLRRPARKLVPLPN